MAEVEKLPSSESGAPTRQSAYVRTVKETVDVVERGWHQFSAAVARFPGERMNEHLGDGEGWTRKQMLAHITAWHDMTNERLAHLMSRGEPVPLSEHEDTINARVARQAVGRTAGEIVKDMELSFKRLIRQIARLSDDQLLAHDAWAAQVIAGNTYEHYAEHEADVYDAPSIDPRRGRR